jgi:hypothetical protein
MVCSNCGSEVAAGSPTCARCGAPQPAGVAPQQAQGYQNPAQGYQNPQNPAGGGWGPPPTMGGGQAPQQSSGFNFDISRWQRAQQITGAATLLLIISLFLPWFTASVSSSVLGHTISDSASASGTTAHGYLWLVFFVGLAVLAVLVIQAGFARFPVNLPFGETQLLIGLTAVNLVLVLLAFLLKPGTGGVDTEGLSVSIGWAFGAFIALIAAIAAFVPLVLPATRPQGR